MTLCSRQGAGVAGCRGWQAGGCGRLSDNAIVWMGAIVHWDKAVVTLCCATVPPNCISVALTSWGRNRSPLQFPCDPEMPACPAKPSGILGSVRLRGRPVGNTYKQIEWQLCSVVFWCGQPLSN